MCVCRAIRLEKASKEFNGLAQRTEQQATAFEHKVPCPLFTTPCGQCPCLCKAYIGNKQFNRTRCC